MLACFGWIFGSKDKEECQSDPNVESLLGSTTRDAYRNQNPCYDFHEVPNSDPFGRTVAPTSYSTHFINQSNALNTSCSNVSKFTQKSSAPSAQNKQKETLNTFIVTKRKLISIDSGLKPETITVRTLEKSTEASQRPKILPLSSTQTCAGQNRTINPNLDRITDPKLSHNYSSVSSELPPFESKRPLHSSKTSSSLSGTPPSSPKPYSSLPSSSFGAPPAFPNCPPISNKPTLSLFPFNPTTRQEKTEYIWAEKGTSPPSSPKSDSSLASSSFGAPPASPKCPTISNKPTLFQSPFNPTTQQEKTKYIWVEKGTYPPSSPKSDSSLASSSFGAPPASPKYPTISNKPTLSLSPFNLTTRQTTKYIWVEKGTSPLYVIPEDIKGLINTDIVPGVLRMPLSSLRYKDYFAALLYAEDYYFEKWDGFEMKNVALEFHNAALKFHKAEIHGKKGKFKNLNRNDEKDDKIFVEFEIDSTPEKRPFLLSRDFAYVRPLGKQIEPFKGIIYRVVKSTLVLVEFGEDFHAQHYADCKYNVKFSFNRVCLKRAHQAIAAASDVLFRNFLFPDCMPKSNLVSKQLLSINHKLDRQQVSAVRWILTHQSPPPYLVRGPLSVTREKQLTRTGEVVREAVIQLCQTSSSNRILICAPSNSTCDVLMRSLQNDILKSDMFRANAAFREIYEVPDDILPFCPYEEEDELFSCPSLPELQKFRVIFSTFMSTFRLHNEGVRAGHFSHIFMVDASSVIEPETLVPLANLANERTAVVITGALGDCSRWVRSNIARQNGLRRSYFERLCESKPYTSLDPEFITQLEGVGKGSDDSYTFWFFK